MNATAPGLFRPILSFGQCSDCGYELEAVTNKQVCYLSVMDAGLRWVLMLQEMAQHGCETNLTQQASLKYCMCRTGQNKRKQQNSLRIKPLSIIIKLHIWITANTISPISHGHMELYNQWQLEVRKNVLCFAMIHSVRSISWMHYSSFHLPVKTNRAEAPKRVSRQTNCPIYVFNIQNPVCVCV